MSIAQTILQQLGGNKFIAMTGAKLSSDARALIIKLPRSLVTVIELMPDDTYKVKTGRMASMKQIFQGKPAVKWIHESTDIYNDQLQEIFTRQTGLDTHL